MEKKNINRRKFLGTAGLAAAASVTAGSAIAFEFAPLTEDEMKAIEYKTLPIVRQGLYFRRWELGV
jgi:nitrous oxide reductase